MKFGEKDNPTQKNSIRENSVENENIEKKKKSKKQNKQRKSQTDFGILRGLSSIMNGNILTSEILRKNIPFICYILLLIMIYIANNFYSQSKAKEIDSIGKELKELRDEDISTKSYLMYFTKRSELAKRLESRNIKESKEPPHKIYVNEN